MIYPTINEITLDGLKCIKVEFEGKEKHYAANGIYYKRIVDRSEKMTAEELKNTLASMDYISKWAVIKFLGFATAPVF